MCTHAVPQAKVHRIRRSLRRLSLPDVAEMWRIAKSNAATAASAGDRDREAYCLAVVRETEATFDAVRCQIEPPEHATAV